MTIKGFSHTSDGLDPKNISYLEAGRYRLEIDKVKELFVENKVFEDSVTRAWIWETFEILNTFLRDRTPIIKVWLSGSFISNKLNPSDLDVTYVIRADLITVEVFHLLDKLLSAHQNDGYPIDVHYFLWASFDRLPSESKLAEDYAYQRGFWDDFWSRKRNRPKTDQIEVIDTLPVRGYLEVELDGFQIEE